MNLSRNLTTASRGMLAVVALACMGPWNPAAIAEESLGSYVLLVANRAVPDSLAIANYYADKRGVPKANLCMLDCPTTEVVSRADYAKTIEGPIRDFMEKNGLLQREPVITPGDATTARAAVVTIKNKIRYL